MANSLSENEKNFLKNSINNGRIRTAVTGINKETGDILFLPINIKNN